MCLALATRAVPAFVPGPVRDVKRVRWGGLSTAGAGAMAVFQPPVHP